MSKIIDVKAREILDSRGFPTIEVDILSENGGFGRSSVPSGASTGSNEALELRDNDDRFLGKGVLKAVKNVNDIIKPKLIGMEVKNQREIDEMLINLDGTDNKSNLGANAILGVSLSCIKAASNEENLELYEYVGNFRDLPCPMLNILNGGMHADNSLDFQEFMIVPTQSDFKDKIRCASEVFHTLKKILKENNLNTNVGDEGGFAPDIKSNEEALDYIVKAIDEAGYSGNVKLALDVAASEFYKDGLYEFSNNKFNTDEMIEYYKKLIEKYPIISIEDPLDENDFEGFSKLTSEIKNISFVGDDFFTTNKKLLQKGIDMKAGNSILIKFNQIGTVSEALDTIKLAKENNYKTIISHRSGETEDTFISDFAVGLSLGWIKTGSISRIDRVAKYNRLLRIYEQINEK